MSTKLTTGEEANHFIEKVREKYLSKTEVFNLQDKTVTENGEVKADENYYGLNKVNVNVLPVMEPITVISSVTGTEQIINPPSGVTGFSKITVNPIDLQDKTVVPNENIQEVTADTGYSGLNKVTVNKIETEQKTVKSTTSEQTITPTVGKYIDSITVEALELENKTVKSTTTEQTIQPTTGKDGISEITVEALDLETKTVKSSTTQQTIQPAAGKDGISEITVEALNSQEKVVTPGTESQEITPDIGYDVLSKVTVNPIDLEDKTITENGVYTSETKSGFGEVTVDVQNLDLQKLFTGIPEPLDEISEELAQGLTTYPNVNNFYVKKITIPNSVNTLPEITNNTVLEEIVVDNKPNLNIDSMTRCFYNLQNLKKITFKNLNNKLIFDTRFTVQGLFSNNPKLEEFEFPSVNTLSIMNTNGRGFFYNCTSLKSVKFNNVDEGDTLTNICHGCTSLTSFSIPDNITRLISAPSYNSDGGCFYNCTSLTNINFNNVKVLDNYCFTLSGLTSVNSDKITSIGRYAFYMCNKLANIDLPAVTSIADNAFRNCSNLTSISLPLVTKIEDSTFNSCAKLTNIELPAVTSIAGNAFNGCTSLTNIDLPAATSIANSVFEGCNKLASVNLPVATTIGHWAFYGCTRLANIELPALTTIESEAFASCASLTSIELPAITTIKNRGFSNCYNLTGVTLGSALTTIDATAFFGCTNLTEINIYAPKSQVTTAANAPWGAPSACQVNWLDGE